MQPELLRVLYVEDNPVDADLISRELARLAPQIRLEVVATLGAARERLTAEPSRFDVMLTDLRLPDGTGLELLSHVRAHQLPLAVVIITGSGDQEAAVTALKAGADDYLVKRIENFDKLPQVLHAARQHFLESAVRRATPLGVLYAEPNPFDVDLTKRYLAQHAPYLHLTAVADGREILAKLPDSPDAGPPAVDVLLLDYHLPGLNALEIVKILREERKLDIPIVMITGHGNEDVAIQALRLGSDDYLVKHEHYLPQLPIVIEKVCKQAELRRSETRYRTLFEANPHPMWVYDLETLAFLAVNDAAVAHYGYGREEFLAMTIKDIRSAADVPHLPKKAARGRDGGRKVGGTCRHKTKNGSVIDVETSTHTLTFNGRQAEMVLAHDVTERLQAEAERQELIAQLEKRNAELERFTYTVSHDLKSPLVTILGFTGQLEQDLENYQPANIKADIAFIRKAAGHMNELLGSLLELSRAGRAIGDPQPVDLAALARQTAEPFSERLSRSNLRCDIPTDLPLVTGDPVRLREVLQNLLENAVKFTAGQAAPCIEIGCRPGDGEVLCFVRDNGIGIPAEYQEKIFGLFEKLDPAREGTGIGLSIVRRIVEEHGGRTWVESAGKGHGSTFFFTVPV